MNDYIFPDPLQKKLDQIRTMTPEQIMQDSVPPVVANLIGGLINSSLPEDTIAVAFMVGLGTLLGINEGQAADFGGQSQIERDHAIRLSQEDILQMHFAIIRHIAEQMTVQVRAEHMDRKANQSAPTRAM